MKNAESMKQTAGSAVLQLGKDGTLVLPLEAVQSLCLKEGDELECIYGKQQIGLSPIKHEMRGSIFFQQSMHLLLWQIQNYGWSQTCSHIQ